MDPIILNERTNYTINLNAFGIYLFNNLHLFRVLQQIGIQIQ